MMSCGFSKDFERQRPAGVSHHARTRPHEPYLCLYVVYYSSHHMKNENAILWQSCLANNNGCCKNTVKYDSDGRVQNPGRVY